MPGPQNSHLAIDNIRQKYADAAEQVGNNELPVTCMRLHGHAAALVPLMSEYHASSERCPTRSATAV